MTAGPDTTSQLLVVSAQDRARGPVLAQLLRREAAKRALEALVWIEDAGLEAQPGEPLLASVERAVRPLGLGLEDHRARPLTLQPGDRHHLVLTMTEAHRRALVRDRRDLLARTFTVREVVRLMSSNRWEERWEGTSLLVPQLHRLRPLVPPAAGPEDVADPASGGRRLATLVVEELRWCSVRLATALWGPSDGAAQTATVGR